MLRDMKCPQRLTRVLAFRINGLTVNGGVATTTGILEGKFHGTITENSAGNYTITFNQAFARVPVVLGLVTLTDVTTLRVVTVTASAINIEQVGADQDTPSADGSFHVTLLGFDTADET